MSDALRTIAFPALLAALLIVAAFVLVRRMRATHPLAPPDALPDTQPHVAEAPPAPEPSAVRPAEQTPLPPVLIDPTVLVRKGARTLTVFSEGRPVKVYAIALGFAPEGHKLREGDGRTPEGAYHVCVKNADSRYHRALGLSYPNAADADAALTERAITARDHRAIMTAARRMERPPWKTPLGGEIMIHGGGSARGDWTQGCIALEDASIEELFMALPLGTPVTIEP